MNKERLLTILGLILSEKYNCQITVKGCDVNDNKIIQTSKRSFGTNERKK